MFSFSQPGLWKLEEEGGSQIVGQFFFFFCRKYYVDVQLDDMPKNAEMARSNRFELICKRRPFIRDSYSIYITCLTYIDKQIDRYIDILTKKIDR